MALFSLDHVLDPAPLFVTPKESLAQIWTKWQHSPSRYVVVHDEDHPYLGVLTERACLQAVLERGIDWTAPIPKTLITPIPPRVVQGELSSLELGLDALDWLRGHQEDCLPLLSPTGDLLGLVSEAGLLRALVPHPESLLALHLMAARQKCLSHPESRLNTLLNNSNLSLICFRYSDKGRFTVDYSSQGTNTVFGYSPEQLLGDGQVWGSRIPASDWEKMVEPYLQSLSTLEPHQSLAPATLEYRFQHSDGSIHWISSTLIAQLNPHGGWNLTAFSSDISEAKQAEADLLHTHQQLEFALKYRIQSEAKLSAILDSGIASIIRYRIFSPDPEAAVPPTQPDQTPHWAYEYVSKGCEQIFGYTPQDLQADPYLWQHCIPAEDWQTILVPRYEKVFQQQPCSVEYRFRHQDGSVRWIREVLTSRWDDQDGSWVCTVISTDTTDRKLADLALRQSLAQQHALISALPDLMMRLNRDGIYLDCVVPSLGFNCISPDHALIGTHVSQSLPPPLAQKRIDAIEQALATNSIQVYEQEIEINGSHHVEECRVVVSGSDEVLILVRDITERQQAEAALKLSERRYSSLAEAAPVGIFRTDPQGHCIYINDRYTQITGLSWRLAQGIGWTQGLYPEDRDRIAASWYEAAQSHTPFQQEYRFVRPGKSPVWVYGQAVAETDPHGNVVGYVGTITDITARKQAESDLQQLNQALEARVRERTRQLEAEIEERKRSETLLSKLIETLPMRVWMRNGQGQLIVQNTADIASFGNQLGKSIAEMDLPEEVRQLWQQDFARVKAGETLRRERQEAQDRYISLMTLPIPAGSEEIGALGIAIDITEQRRTEDQLRHSLQEKDVLLREVNHRVKNNLQVLSSIFSLQSHYVQDPGLASILTEMRNRINSMALVHEKLYQSEDLAHINFADYVESLASNLMMSSTGYPNHHQLDLQIERINLGLDATLACGLLINELISNCLKHAFPAQRSGQLRIHFMISNPPSCLLSVSDDGVGLPDQFQIGQSSSLGLCLVEALTRQLRGQLTITPLQPQERQRPGTLVQIYFPCLPS